jgi:gentisate 1,2-dioxygenase
VLVCANPGLGGKPYTSQSILAAYALYNPGETAPVHRHTPSAARFVLEGAGGYTMVAGEKITMSRGDLVLTPARMWHDHGNDGDAPVIWVDILNFPLVEVLDATIFEFDYSEPNEAGGQAEPRDRQTLREPPGHSGALYATGGLKPLFVDHRRGPTEHSPQFFYRYVDTRAALERMRAYAGSPYEGIIVEYTDPTTGGPAMPSLSFRAQLLRRGETTRRQRRMASTVYCVIEGRGSSEIGGRRFDWQPNDIFVVPNWTWCRHLAASEDVVLLSATDEPVMQAMGLYRHEGEAAPHVD